MDQRHTELEYKFEADHVHSGIFVPEMMGDRPNLYEQKKTFDDVYYKCGEHVVRHRHARGGELTVKERKSQDSIMDRVEVNLCFSPKTNQEDVEAFLKLTGYERMFAVRKHYVHIFEFHREDYEVEVCLYSVSRVDEWGESNYRKFVEVEIKRNPGSDYEDYRIKGALESWRKYLQSKFKLGEPLNESLLEIYSKLETPTNLALGTNYRI